MKNWKHKFFYLLITITFLFLSKVKGQHIFYFNENVTKLKSNETEPLTNIIIPYFSNMISNDTLNNTQGNIIKAIVGFDNFIFDIARNITSGMRFAQFLFLNKTKTFILPFIMFPDQKSFKNSILNSTELDSSNLGNLLPINVNLTNPEIGNFTNSTLENVFIKPELSIPYLRGSNKIIRYNDTTNEIAKNFTDLYTRNESGKIVNSTMVRLNKFLVQSNNDTVNFKNKTATNRFLQFTLSFGLGELGNEYTDPSLINGDGIPDVGNSPFFIPGYNPWETTFNDYDSIYDNGFGLDYE
ncbi:uncharacterized protein cubi_03493 [Cryptosporidium ubiquitum]|uniref:Uncharacterized protein n=1 Tax=Cryptosporidium ubiquitum TaxID=857276 RepID=A0A1J4MI50_9CRYT|nr:uncharacterized protein cubi_03493 [Cryptosporidium ubiquitum]OII73695.1 hypothetical protein cubi_03493 [Cryptosporidium ubiquitum]